MKTIDELQSFDKPREKLLKKGVESLKAYELLAIVLGSGTKDKHHYKYVDKFDSNEEYECAKYIDALPEVSSWIKNISRDFKNSFWLQTSSDKFYPDFIIKLKSGKIIVAEYKGDNLRTNDDTKEKELIGKTWASLVADVDFTMLYKDDYKEKLGGLSKGPLCK